MPPASRLQGSRPRVNQSHALQELRQLSSSSRPGAERGSLACWAATVRQPWRLTREETGSRERFQK